MTDRLETARACEHRNRRQATPLALDVCRDCGAVNGKDGVWRVVVDGVGVVVISG